MTGRVEKVERGDGLRSPFSVLVKNGKSNQQLEPSSTGVPGQPGTLASFEKVVKGRTFLTPSKG
jgi:hypothetical protein